MTNKSYLPSAKSLQNQINTLKPTTTVVRGHPIVVEGWEIAALGGDTFTRQELENEVVNQAAIEAFQNALASQKKMLQPTKTVVKHSLTVTTPEAPTGTKPTTILTNLKPAHWTEAHGFLGKKSWEFPRQVVHCEAEARPGYATKLAHEYEDSPTVLQAKVEILARIMEASQRRLVYSGAGISTNSGISDYATRSGQRSDRPQLRSPMEAQPTFAHRALVALHEANFVKYWVQQNHDGLPQKAGLPQHAINEIHGAWYDPSNPVVAMNGNLRSDLFNDMLIWEKRTDLTLSLGTSMCGMNSDRVFTTVAWKGKKKFRKYFAEQERAHIFGGVIINRQQTQHDHLSCLRIYADLDEVMHMLMHSLGMKKRAEECLAAMLHENKHLTLQARRGIAVGEDDIFRVPYCSDGTKRTADNYIDGYSILDLRKGSKVRLTASPHEGDCGEVLGKNKEGHYRIQLRHLIGITKRPFTSLLGSWWTEAAVNGHVDTIPVVNIE